MIINKKMINDIAIKMLLKSPIGEKLDSAIAGIEKIQIFLAAAEAKSDEKELNAIKAPTIAGLL